jgi:hypothetical protein
LSENWKVVLSWSESESDDEIELIGSDSESSCDEGLEWYLASLFNSLS